MPSASTSFCDFGHSLKIQLGHLVQLNVYILLLLFHIFHYTNRDCVKIMCVHSPSTFQGPYLHLHYLLTRTYSMQDNGFESKNANIVKLKKHQILLKYLPIFFPQEATWLDFNGNTSSLQQQLSLLNKASGKNVHLAIKRMWYSFPSCFLMTPTKFKYKWLLKNRCKKLKQNMV